MTDLTRRLFSAGGIGAALLAGSGSAIRLAHAQDYPARFVRVIVGPGPDIIARFFGPEATKALGQEIVVEPRPGAGGIIAAQTVAGAQPDGYTLLMSTASYTIGAAIGTMQQDLRKDFAPIMLAVTAPFVLCVHPSVQAKTVADLVAYAKANPGKLNYASSGIGTPPHLAAELFKTMAGVDLVHVPFREANSAMNALVAGSVQINFAIATVAMSQVNSGMVRGLGVSTLAPSELAPGMSLIAAALPGYEVQGWNGFVAPRATPKAIVDKLNAAFARGLDDADLRKRLIAAGYEPAAHNTPEAFGDFIRRDTQKWIDLVKSANIKVK